jgi:hypothetical protein
VLGNPLGKQAVDTPRVTEGTTSNQDSRLTANLLATQTPSAVSRSNASSSAIVDEDLYDDAEDSPEKFLKRMEEDDERECRHERGICGTIGCFERFFFFFFFFFRV